MGEEVFALFSLIWPFMGVFTYALGRQAGDTL